MALNNSEEHLVRQSIAGDKVALGQLLLSYYDRLERHVVYQIPQDLRALVQSQDILQQTCVRAFSAIGAFQLTPKSSFYGWLRTIADNLVKDAAKHRRRERRASTPSEPSTNSQSYADLFARMALSSTTPSRTAVTRESVRCLQLALASLPQEYREVIRLRYLEGRSIEEIAATMGRSTNAIRGLCYRAKEKLHDALGRSSAYFGK